MPRQRPAIPVILPFEYVLLGRPYSWQNKSSGYTAWVRRLIDAVTDAIDTASTGRLFVPTGEEVRVLIVWLSAQPNADSHPDLDTILKPIIDAMSEKVRMNYPNTRDTAVIKDDRQTRRIEAALINLNSPGLQLPWAVIEKQEEEAYVFGEVIYVRLDLRTAADGPEWGWWI
jgi:Holliday junction resolvase RusA-like endonuclease